MRSKLVSFVSVLAVLLAVSLVGVTAPIVEAAGSFPLNGLVDLDVAMDSACAVFPNGAVTCWGNGSFGHYTGTNLRSRSVPTAIVGVTDAVQVATGTLGACARLGSGGVQCWGASTISLVAEANDSITPQTIAGLSNVIDIGVGSQFVCALIQGGTVKCWGGNSEGQTGVSPSAFVATPTTVAGLTNVTKLSVGFATACAIRSDATARCWGSNLYGQAGTGATTPVLTPTSPTGLSSVVDISVGWTHSCALVAGMFGTSTYCWGNDSFRQLGSTTPGSTDTPHLAAAGGLNGTQIAADGYHTCVRRSTGAIACWGRNADGELGDGSHGPAVASAVVVSGISTAVEVGVGLGSCARLEDGSIQCWGRNDHGVLGLGVSDNGLGMHPLPETIDLPIPEFSPIDPVRLLDTRPTGVTVDHESEKGGLVGANQTVKVRVRGRAGIPGTAPSVVLNITAVAPTGSGFVTVWPCNVAKPLASNLNVIAGVNRANLVVATVTPSGPDADRVCLSPSVPMHLLADIGGFYSAAGDFAPLSPARLLDTRAAGDTIDGLFEAGGLVPGGSTLQLTVGGRGGVAANATGVVLNVTSVQASANGFVTVWPCTVPKPVASNLNVTAGVNVANLVLAALNSGDVCLSPSSTMHLVVDVAGYVPPASPFVSAEPYRLLDTRPNGSTVDDDEVGAGVMTPGQVKSVTAVGRSFTTAGPAVARTVVLTLTAVAPTGTGYLSVYPCPYIGSGAAPAASNLNVTAGVNSAATVMVELGGLDSVCIYTSVTTHVLLDIDGWYAY